MAIKIIKLLYGISSLAVAITVALVRAGDLNPLDHFDLEKFGPASFDATLAPHSMSACN